MALILIDFVTGSGLCHMYCEYHNHPYKGKIQITLIVNYFTVLCHFEMDALPFCAPEYN